VAMQEITDVTEQKRLNEAREKGIPWKKWGPYRLHVLRESAILVSGRFAYIDLAHPVSRTFTRLGLPPRRIM